MNTMPSFTAEASLYKGKGFGKRIITESQDETDVVQPAAKSVCDMLFDLAWTAYFSRNYVMLAVMDSAIDKAGC
jgi:hypothetical protein